MIYKIFPSLGHDVCIDYKISLLDCTLSNAIYSTGPILLPALAEVANCLVISKLEASKKVLSPQIK